MTLADIARLAGVSRTTASYVVNGKAQAHRISHDTVEKVLAVVEQYQYRVDAQAAALRRGQSRMLGLIVPDLENASYARLAKHLERGAREQGFQLLIAGSDDDPETERELALALRGQRCQILIVASSLMPNDGFYRDLMADGLPVIAVDRMLDPGHFACIVSHDIDAAETLTRSLMTPDVRRLAWFDAVEGLSITRKRRQGFYQALSGTGATPLIFTARRYARGEGARLMHRLLDEQGLPDALITASYTLLDGVFDVLLKNAGLPDTLRLATFGDDRLLDFLPQRVNSLPQDHARIAELTLNRALAAARGEYRPGCEFVERSLRRRSTSA
ncbi:catabolite repressor/activator [Halomonas sp. PR-M31]|uniref:catabolite repressor/activator n=1 Tax=Halomonas sp. PR-M31 TaxID=1471202 RepID=UPI0006522C4C|nr:catabolite repressor/activator [Halomonas sp. PR-M31]